MNLEDIIYLLLLLFCMVFGAYYRKIENVDTKKNVGTLLGLSIVIIVSGIHTIHLLITTFINAYLILYKNKR